MGSKNLALSPAAGRRGAGRRVGTRYEPCAQAGVFSDLRQCDCAKICKSNVVTIAKPLKETKESREIKQIHRAARICGRGVACTGPESKQNLSHPNGNQRKKFLKERKKITEGSAPYEPLALVAVALTTLRTDARAGIRARAARVSMFCLALVAPFLSFLLLLQ